MDFILVMLLLTINACLGFYEEHTSGNAMEALKSQLAPTAMALRDGEYNEISAFDLVPGDVIQLTLGDVVPADVKLLGKEGGGGGEMKVDQSSLTGMFLIF